MKLASLVPMLLAAAAAMSAAETEKIRNPRVVVTEDVLAPGESRSWKGEFPSLTVYAQAGSVAVTPAPARNVKAGEVEFSAVGARSLKNAGAASLRVIRVVFPGKGDPATWGNAGITNYKMMLENQSTRVYEIRIPAGTSEPLHTHKDRVVVCLSGADLVHDLQDGRKEPATLKTGEIAWRLGATHVGHNVGKTDLWVIAIEPK